MVSGSRTPTGSRSRRAKRLLPLGLAVPLIFAACDEGGPTGAEFTVSPPEATLEVGASLQLSARGAPGSVEWSSSNSSVASVIPETGFVTAVSRGDVLVTAVSGSQSASAEIRVRNPPTIALGAESVDFEATRGDQEPRQATIEVTNSGDFDLEGLRIDGITYGQGESGGWLDVALDGTTAPAVLLLEASPAGLDAGLHTAIVAVGAPGALNSPQVLSVTLAVFEPARIVVSPTQVELAGIPDVIVTAAVEITNGGDRPLVELAATVEPAGQGDPSWLQLALNRTEAPAELTLSANTEGLAVGQYEALVRISSGVEGVDAVDLPVLLTVSPGPAIGLAPTQVSFGAVQGEDPPPPATVDVTNSGGGTLTDLELGAVQYDIGHPTGWLSAVLEATEAPTSIVLTADHSGLASGSYSAQVPVTSPVASNSPRMLDVTLTVGVPPELAVSPTSLSFSAPRNGANPSAQMVNVTNAGGGTLDGLSAHVTYTGGGASGWLSVSWENGSTTAPTRLRVQPQTGTLPEGTYTASVEIRSTVEGVAPKTVSVTFVVALSFQLDVWPIIDASCTGCHFSGGTTVPTLEPASTAYSRLLNGEGGKGPWVVPGNSNAGSPALMCLLNWQAGCPDMPPASQLSSAQRTLIARWINQGAFF